MFYISWIVGMIVAIFITVTVVAKIEKSGFFDKYNSESQSESSDKKPTTKN